jgi:hypothetical protein
VEPIRPPAQCAPEAFSLGIKRQRREAHHSPPSTAEVKNGKAIPTLLIRLREVMLSINYAVEKLYFLYGAQLS